MANFSSYANYGYLALKEETSGVVKPDVYIRTIEDSIVPENPIDSVNEISGDRHRNIRSVRGQRESEGTVNFNIEAKQIGHFLKGVFGQPITQTLTAGKAYRHTFQVLDNLPEFTFDKRPAQAPWVFRHTGCRITEMEVTRDDNKIVANCSVKPTKSFMTTRVLETVAAGTELKIGQTFSLTTDDILYIASKVDGYTLIKELDVVAIVDENTVTVSTIDVSIPEGSIVHIKAAVIGDDDYNQDPVFTFMGGSNIKVGQDIDNLLNQDKEDFSITFMNDFESRWVSGCNDEALYPNAIITKGYTSELSFNRFYDNNLNLAKVQDNESFGTRIFFCGNKQIDDNAAVAASSTWGGANGFSVTAAVAGMDGNDISVAIQINTIDTLEVVQDGNSIIVKLANTTSASNTGTLIAAAINALTIVSSVAVGTGTEEFTTPERSQNLGFRVDKSGALIGTNVVGRNANENTHLYIDSADCRIASGFPEGAEDNILEEELEITCYKDVERANPKGWANRVFLINDVTSY